MKRVLATGLMFLVGVFGIPVAEAAPSATINVTVTITLEALDVSVTPGNWAVGDVVEGASPDTTAGAPLTATNNRNAAEDLTLSVADSASWNAGNTAGADQFAMNFSTNGGTTWFVIDSAAGATLVSDLGAGASQDFDLQLLAPTSTSAAGVQQTIVVTVTAS